MLKNITRVFFGDPHKREIERLRVLVEQINQLEADFEKLDDQTLRKLTDKFKTRLANDETLDDILVEAFAAVREASKRTIGLRHFNVQMIGGIAMHEGMIAEMRTGEGKTLVATLPLYLNALSGKGVHLVTVNDYLARRDARWMAPIFHFLGLTVGVLQSKSENDPNLKGYIVDLGARSIEEDQDQLRIVSRQDAYAADITYGTNNQFGFDYLRDNLIMDMRNRVQRKHHFAIIDEVDNILIDEARTPLIISGPASEDVEWYSKMAVVVKQLDPEDYDFDEKDRSVALTEIGEIHVEELLQIPLRDPDRPEDITPQQARLLGYLEQALRAELLFRKNKDYIVKNNQVVIVDEFTGRLMPGRRWSEGLHQAVEAKEGVEVQPENITHATITLQNYFRKYEKLSGMTGTALTEAEEFSTIYDLDVLEIPTNLDYEASQPESDLITLQARDEEGYLFTYYAKKDDPKQNAVFWKRKDYPDLVYRTEEAKIRAICLEIIKLNIIGRPQLIGTTSIEHSERLSDRLHADMIQRLLSINLMRQLWMTNNQIEFLERVVPELAPLNAPLSNLNMSALRKVANKIKVKSINLDNTENQNIVLDFLGLEISQENRNALSASIKGGIAHQVLNALKHDRESQIIEGAGAYRAVTIATNMAGRGVDIKLGGEIKETILSDIRQILTREGIDPYGMSNREMADRLSQLTIEFSASEKESIDSFTRFLEGMDKVRQAGGLHVIGSERHDARRIDNQLRGRSGRQGDPGSSRFYLSLEDDLMRMFGGERAENMMRIFNLDPSLPIESKIIGRLVEQAQERVEGYNFDIRKHLLDYDNVLNDQRERIYEERDQVLVKENLYEDVWAMLENEIEQRVLSSQDDPMDGRWKLLAFLEEIQPTITLLNDDVQVQSFTIQQLEKYVIDEVGKPLEMDRVREELIAITEQTLLTQKNHLISQSDDFILRTIDSFRVQLNERFEMVDIFLENISVDSNLSDGEFKTQLQKSIQLKTDINQSLMQGLKENDRDAMAQLKDVVESQLKQIIISRVLMTIEQRIGQKLGVSVEDLAPTTWDGIREKIISILDERFSKNADLHEQPNHPIIQNLDRLLRQQFQDSGTTVDIGSVLNGMAVGKQVAINQETHKRVYRRVKILNYGFFVANNCLATDPQQITKEIIVHLTQTQKKLQLLWGKMEIQRLAKNDLSFNQLSEPYKQQIKNNITNKSLEQIKNKKLRDIFAKEPTDILTAFGKSVQQVIYRQILLKSITDLWMEHLTRMEALRVSIRMEAYGQRDPLVQYKSYSTDAFKELLANIRLSVVSKIFRVQAGTARSNASGKITKPHTGAGIDKAQKKKKKRKRHKKKP